MISVPCSLIRLTRAAGTEPDPKPAWLLCRAERAIPRREPSGREGSTAICPRLDRERQPWLGTVRNRAARLQNPAAAVGTPIAISASGLLAISGAAASETEFATDSPLEKAGFETWVTHRRPRSCRRPTPGTGRNPALMRTRQPPLANLMQTDPHTWHLSRSAANIVPRACAISRKASVSGSAERRM
jgi:hypothetical protein